MATHEQFLEALGTAVQQTEKVIDYCNKQWLHHSANVNELEKADALLNSQIEEEDIDDLLVKVLEIVMPVAKELNTEIDVDALESLLEWLIDHSQNLARYYEAVKETLYDRINQWKSSYTEALVSSDYNEAVRDRLIKSIKAETPVLDDYIL